ncbi:uncharacterized protein LOC111276957 isoform X4 [Durio zibethinus]|uniref:Uncharacterized protein LOC111276957 isoform X4 n=1 Tax=Durio zibethinus TaxID=66656 RepID=A0A6P5WS38_DURZI|nr:uncharacterized protein LOC111276957 isoform X4 [Durio zibethinus]
MDTDNDSNTIDNDSDETEMSSPPVPEHSIMSSSMSIPSSEQVMATAVDFSNTIGNKKTPRGGSAPTVRQVPRSARRNPFPSKVMATGDDDSITVDNDLDETEMSLPPVLEQSSSMSRPSCEQIMATDGDSSITTDNMKPPRHGSAPKVRQVPFSARRNPFPSKVMDTDNDSISIDNDSDETEMSPPPVLEHSIRSSSMSIPSFEQVMPTAVDFSNTIGNKKTPKRGSAPTVRQVPRSARRNPFPSKVMATGDDDSITADNDLDETEMSLPPVLEQSSSMSRPSCEQVMATGDDDSITADNDLDETEMSLPPVLEQSSSMSRPSCEQIMATDGDFSDTIDNMKTPRHGSAPTVRQVPFSARLNPFPSKEIASEIGNIFHEPQTTSLEVDLRQLFEPSSDANRWTTLYKVPHRLRQVNPKAYEPNVISIGPRHHGKQHLKATEVIKSRLFSRMIKDSKLEPKDFVETMKPIEKQVRECYEEPLDHIDSDTFVKMMILDGCFIVQLFQVIPGPKIFPDKKCPISAKDTKHLLSLVHDNWLPSSQGIKQHKHFKAKADRCCWICCARKREEKDRRLRKNMRCATDLKAAGISFSENNEKNLHSLFEIKFKNKKLKIPKLSIEHCTDRLLRNFIAYEQFIPSSEPTYVCDYVVFMHNLINSGKDVKFLRHNGIFDNCLGDDEAVAKMFNKLGDCTYSSEDFYYAEIFYKVGKRRRRRCITLQLIIKLAVLVSRFL